MQHILLGCTACSMECTACTSLLMADFSVGINQHLLLHLRLSEDTTIQSVVLSLFKLMRQTTHCIPRSIVMQKPVVRADVPRPVDFAEFRRLFILVELSFPVCLQEQQGWSTMLTV